MFIRPNEFEAQLATTRAAAAAPVYRKSHRGAGVIFLVILLPVMLAWLAFLTCCLAVVTLARAPIAGIRRLRDMADYGGEPALR
jgi:hypothetical protein